MTHPGTSTIVGSIIYGFRENRFDNASSFCINYLGNYDKESSHNVCLIKIRSKHSSNTLLSLLRFFMRQTLCLCFQEVLFLENCVITNG